MVRPGRYHTQKENGKRGGDDHFQIADRLVQRFGLVRFGISMGPNLADHDKEKSLGEAKKNHSIQRFQGFHHLLVRFQIEIYVSVAGQGAQ
jgi:hypothetical protein